MSIPKSVNLGVLISFVLGLFIYWLADFFIEAMDSPIRSHSDLYPIIYKEIGGRQMLLNELDNGRKVYGDYEAQLRQAADALNNIKLPDPIVIKALVDSSLILDQGRSLIEQINSIRAKIPYPYQFLEQTNDRNTLLRELNNIFNDIDDQFYYSFSIFWPILDSSSQIISQSKISFTPTSIKLALLDTNKLAKGRSDLHKTIIHNADYLRQLESRSNPARDSLSSEIKGLRSSIDHIDQSSKDRMMMYVVIPLFGIIVVLLIAIPFLYKAHPEILQSLFEEKIILQIFTVFILVITILLLGIGNKINSETLGTLLGGISVYILQRTLGERQPISGKNDSKSSENKEQL